MTNKIKFGRSKKTWHKIRNSYIGGSDAASLVGMSPYKSAYGLWLEKTGQAEGFGGNLATEIGTYLEDFVVKKFKKETGIKVDAKECKNYTYVNDDYPFACANLDGRIVGENAFLECKTTANVGILRQIKGTEFPDAYYCQCVHYMAVTGCEKCYLAVLALGQQKEFRVFELERDETEIQSLMKAEEEFWNLVQTNTPPAVDGSEEWTSSLNSRYPSAEKGTSTDLSRYNGLMAEYESIKNTERTLKKRKDEIANILKDAIGSCEAGIGDEYVATWSDRTSRRFDEKTFSAEHPSISLDKYYTVSTSRTFNIKEKKNG